MAAVVALECGWIVTEVGRQPWVVYNVMRTEDAVTKANGVWVSFVAVVVLYVLLGAALDHHPARDGAALARGGRARRRRAVRPRPERTAGGRRRELGMSTADAVAVVLWTGATMYAVFGGADFGAGLWSLLAGGGDRGRAPRELIDWAIGPVWEANHVWLIFVLVVLWTGFSAAFEAIFSTLFIPLSLAALGIVLRGSGFAFHKTARRFRGRVVSEELFGAASLLTPFFMGTVVGAIAGGRVPVGNAAGDAVTSWLNPLSLLIGALFVATGAYLSAVFLVSDARRAGAPALERYFSTRALIAAVVTGGLAAAGLVLLHSDARYLFDGLTGDGLPLVILSLLCGLAVLVLLRRGARRGARPLAVGAVAAVIWGWGVAQHPYLLPQTLTIADARGAERDAHQRPDRLRRRRRPRAAVDRAAVHARPAQPRRGERDADAPGSRRRRRDEGRGARTFLTLRQDVDRARDDETENGERDQRLHRHRALGPPLPAA